MIPEPYDAWLHYLKYAFYVYSVLTLIPQSWRRIREHARRELENERNRRRSCPPKVTEATQVKRRFDSNSVVRRKTIDSIRHSTLGVTKPSALNRSSLVNNGHSQTGELDYREETTNEDFRGTYSVARIANEYERKAQKQKIHVASSDALRKRHTMSFFEGFKIPEVRVDTKSQGASFQLNTSPAPVASTTNTIIDNSNPIGSIEEIHPTLSNSMVDLPIEQIPNGDIALNGHLSGNNSDNYEETDNSLKSTTPTFQLEVIRRKPKTGHVETVEDILVEQRFSRSLSSYSISELLKDQPTEPNIDQIINEIH